MQLKWKQASDARGLRVDSTRVPKAINPGYVALTVPYCSSFPSTKATPGSRGFADVASTGRETDFATGTKWADAAALLGARKHKDIDRNKISTMAKLRTMGV